MVLLSTDVNGLGFTDVVALNNASTTQFQNLAAGAKITETGSATNQFSSLLYNYATPTDAVNITIDGGIAGTTIFPGGPATAAKATLSSTGKANGVTSAGVAAPVNVWFTNGTQTIDSLTVNAATNLRANLSTADFVATGAALTVSGLASNVNLGTAGVYKTIDASGLTGGGVTINLSTETTSFKGGAGNDSVGMNAAGTTAVAGTATIDAGAGVDTVSAALINAGNSAVFKSFERIGLGAGMTGALDVSLLTNSTITGVDYTGALSGATTLTNLVETTAGFDVAVKASPGFNTTLGFTAASVAGTADVLNIGFSSAAAVAVNAGTVTAQGIEQIKIASGGVANATNTIFY